VSRVYGIVTNNNGFWIGWLDLLTPSFTASLLHNQSSVESFLLACRGLAPYSFSFYDWLLSQSQSQSYFTTGCLPPISSSWCRVPWDLRSEFFSQLHTWGHSPYITSSLTRGWVCYSQLLLVLASAFILGPESRGARDHILLSQIRDVLFVASYDSQGYGGGIRPRLHTGNSLTDFWFTIGLLIETRGGHVENTNVAQQWIYANHIENTSSVKNACLLARYLAVDLHVTIYTYIYIPVYINFCLSW
jgi:hypothetical protein